MKIRVTIDRHYGVHGEARVVLPVEADAAWALVADLPSFVRHDLFHRGVTVHGPVAPDSPITIRHGFGGLGFDRVGRVLRCDRARGVTFSDLSRRGARHGFPHVLKYRVEPVGPGRCVLSLTVRGRWTARLSGRQMARLWNRLVLAAMLLISAHHIEVSALTGRGARREGMA